MKTGRTLQLRSRNNKDFSARFPLIVLALAELPSETVIDGELVAFDESGRPSFNSLQNHASTQRIFYYAFDLLILEGRDLRARPLAEGRDLLRSKVLPRLAEPIRYSPTLDGKVSDLIASVRQQKLEGLIAKRTDSAYESGDRSGASSSSSAATRSEARLSTRWFLVITRTASCFMRLAHATDSRQPSGASY
jgi:bifunctional non-homologous end joining protein LigD